MEADQHYYSTPYQLVGKEVDVRSTSGTVEIFYQGKRVASHLRSRQAHKATTDAGHRPKSHQHYLVWTPMRIVEWAGKVGPFAARLVEGILMSKPHPEMGYRSALGVIRLERSYGAERVTLPELVGKRASGASEPYREMIELELSRGRADLISCLLIP